MKITKVDIMQVNVHLERGGGQPAWAPILCRIYTDEGIYGDGEAALAYGVASSGAFGMIKDLSKLIIGMDPLQNEVIWDKLYKATFWGQNGGPVVFAGIGAIDIALWDIKGKAFKAPVWKLLGGKFRNELRCYASQLQFGWSDHFQNNYTIQQYLDSCKTAMDEGYDAIKIDFFTFKPEDGSRFVAEDRTRLQSPKVVQMIVDRVSAVREFVGPNVDIIMENHSYIDANTAVQFARAVEPYNIFYYEEPNTPSPLTSKYLKEKINIPIANGERIYSRWQYAQYFEQNSIQVIQPDLGNMGGLTEGMKVAAMAYVYDVSVQGHVCASPLSTAVCLHFEAAIPNFQIHEHHVYNRYIFNKQLAVKDLQPVNGKFTIPDDPGIGNEISEYCFKETLMKATVE